MQQNLTDGVLATTVTQDQIISLLLIGSIILILLVLNIVLYAIYRKVVNDYNNTLERNRQKTVSLLNQIQPLIRGVVRTSKQGVYRRNTSRPASRASSQKSEASTLPKKISLECLTDKSESYKKVDSNPVSSEKLGGPQTKPKMHSSHTGTKPSPKPVPNSNLKNVRHSTGQHNHHHHSDIHVRASGHMKHSRENLSQLKARDLDKQFQAGTVRSIKSDSLSVPHIRHVHSSKNVHFDSDPKTESAMTRSASANDGFEKFRRNIPVDDIHLSAVQVTPGSTAVKVTNLRHPTLHEKAIFTINDSDLTDRSHYSTESFLEGSTRGCNISDFSHYSGDTPQRLTAHADNMPFGEITHRVPSNSNLTKTEATKCQISGLEHCGDKLSPKMTDRIITSNLTSAEANKAKILELGGSSRTIDPPHKFSLSGVTRLEKSGSAPVLKLEDVSEHKRVIHCFEKNPHVTRPVSLSHGSSPMVTRSRSGDHSTIHTDNLVPCYTGKSKNLTMTQPVSLAHNKGLREIPNDLLQNPVERTVKSKISSPNATKEKVTSLTISRPMTGSPPAKHLQLTKPIKFTHPSIAQIARCSKSTTRIRDDSLEERNVSTDTINSLEAAILASEEAEGNYGEIEIVDNSSHARLKRPRSIHDDYPVVEFQNLSSDLSETKTDDCIRDIEL